MKVTYSNFTLDNTTGDNVLNTVYHASVDVTEHRLFRKDKTTRRKLRREFGGSWYFADNGGFAPCREIDAMARVWTAKTEQKC